MPQSKPIKRVRDGKKYKFEDHTYTFKKGDLFVSMFDHAISSHLFRGVASQKLMATYFVEDSFLLAACIAPAHYISSMFGHKIRQQQNSFEPEIFFKTLPFEEVRCVLSGHQNIPFLYWSTKRDHFEMSNAMRG